MENRITGYTKTTIDKLFTKVVQQIGTKANTTDVTTALATKVDKVTGKGLSTEDYTSEEKTKLSGIEANAEVNIIEDVKVNGTSMQVTNKAVDIAVPTKVSDITNDSGFIDNTVNNLVNYTKTGDMNTAISNAVGTETINRQNADNNLQNQIDAITSASDVVDIVGTYTQLQNYDTSSLTDDDVIKVLQDSTHNNALSYYRWVITNNVGAWSYVGSEGPFYTKGETDTLLNAKYDKPSGGIPKTDLASGIQTSLDKADSALQEHQDITGKENISNKVTTIDDESTDTQYPSAKCVYDRIAELEEENALLRKDIAGLPTATATGESIDATDSAEMRLEKLQIGGNTKQASYQGYNLWRPNVSLPFTRSGVTVDYDEYTQVYTVNGNGIEGAFFNIFEGALTDVAIGDTFIMKIEKISGSVNKPLYVGVYKDDSELGNSWVCNVTLDSNQTSNTNVKTVSKAGTTRAFFWCIEAGYEFNNLKVRVLFAKSSNVSLNWEPYCRTDKLVLTQIIHKR